VDDVEFLFSADQSVIDVRSASRVGYYDFGMNRRRIEDIRKKWNEGLIALGCICRTAILLKGNAI
jgi:uncharacterized protein (DUF1499 family)